MDYGDIIYDKRNIKSLKNEIGNIQCKDHIPITGAVQRRSREHLYQELGLNLNSLQNRRCYLKLIFFQKIVNTIIPAYLTNCLNTNYNLVYNTRASEQSNIRRFRTRTEHFKQPFSLSVSMDGTN